MKFLRRVVAILLLPALCVLVLAFLLGSTFNETLLRGAFLKSELRQVNAYDVAVGQLTSLVSTIGKSDQSSEESFNISSLGLEPVIQAIVTPAWLQREVEQNLDHLDRWLNHKKPLVLQVNTADRKPILQAQLRLWLEQKISSLPKCSLQEFQRRLQAEKDINAFCRPPGLTVDTLLAQLKDSGIDVDTFIAALPDETDLLQPQTSLQPFFEKLGQPSSPQPNELKKVSDQLERVREYVRTGRNYLFLTFVAILVLLGIEILLMAHGKKTVVRWMSVLLSATAVLPLVVGVAGYVAGRTVIPAQVPLENLSPEIRTAVLALAQNIMDAVFLPLIIYGVVVIIISMGLKITSKFLRDEKATPKLPHPKTR